MIIATDTAELRAFLALWVEAYRKRWADSPYGGPAEPLPSHVQEYCEAFLDAFEADKIKSGENKENRE